MSSTLKELESSHLGILEGTIQEIKTSSVKRNPSSSPAEWSMNSSFAGSLAGLRQELEKADSDYSSRRTDEDVSIGQSIIEGSFFPISPSSRKKQFDMGVIIEPSPIKSARKPTTDDPSTSTATTIPQEVYVVTPAQIIKPAGETTSTNYTTPAKPLPRRVLSNLSFYTTPESRQGSSPSSSQVRETSFLRSIQSPVSDLMQKTEEKRIILKSSINAVRVQNNSLEYALKREQENSNQLQGLLNEYKKGALFQQIVKLEKQLEANKAQHDQAVANEARKFGLLEVHVSNLEQEVQSHEKSQEKIFHLTMKCSQLEADHRKSHSQRIQIEQDLTLRVQELVVEKEQLQAKCNQFEANCNDESRRRMALEREVKETRALHSTLELDLQHAKRQLQQTGLLHKETLESEKDKMLVQLQAEKEQHNEELQSKFHRLLFEQKHLESQLEGTRSGEIEAVSELYSLKGLYSALEYNLQNVKMEREDLYTKLMTAEEERAHALQGHYKEKSSLQAQIEDLEQENSKLIAEKGQEHSQRLNLENDLKDTCTRQEETLQSLNGLVELYATLQKSMKTLLSERDNLVEDQKLLVKKQKETKKSLMEKALLLESECLRLQSQLEDEISTLKTENATQKEHYRALHNEMTVLRKRQTQEMKDYDQESIANKHNIDLVLKLTKELAFNL
jgi:hypothetical protein